MVGARSLVLIAIPTYNRPQGLLRLLKSLENLEGIETATVLIADNAGAAGHAAAVIRDLPQASKVRSRLVVEAVAERGIPQVRNAILNFAFKRNRFSNLVMYDDDETVDPLCLRHLTQAQSDLGADVVQGRIVPLFEDRQPWWCSRLRIYYQTDWPSYGQISHAMDSANVLLTYEGWVKAGEPMFDPEMKLTGGSDFDLFKAYQERGCVTGFAPHAITYEHFGKSRLTMRWAVLRQFRSGIAFTRIYFKHRAAFGPIWKEIAKVVLGCGVGVFQTVVMPWRPMRGILTVASQAGKVAGFFGYRYNEYARTHG